MVARQTLRDHIVEHPEFAFELISRVIRRARMATANARNMALLDVYGRVVHLFDGLASEQPDGTRLVAERPGHVLDRTADRVAAVQRALRAAQHFEALDVVDVEHRTLGAGHVHVVNVETDAGVSTSVGI